MQYYIAEKVHHCPAHQELIIAIPVPWILFGTSSEPRFNPNGSGLVRFLDLKVWSGSDLGKPRTGSENSGVTELYFFVVTTCLPYKYNYTVLYLYLVQYSAWRPTKTLYCIIIYYCVTLFFAMTRTSTTKRKAKQTTPIDVIWQKQVYCYSA